MVLHMLYVRHIETRVAAFQKTFFFEDKHFWFSNAKQSLRETLAYRQNVNIAKNLILFMGDGMGMSTVTAGRILKGQIEGHSGEEAVLDFEKFPNIGLIKVENKQRFFCVVIADSLFIQCMVLLNFF